MNLTEIAPKRKGSNLPLELPELIARQGFYIGQEVFHKNSYDKQKVRISGYVFVIDENNQLQLRYLIQTTESIQRVLEGVFDEPDESIISIDHLIYS